jgi:dTDP-4-dehydrorhamnose 3,5-epimerase-like enzyme
MLNRVYTFGQMEDSTVEPGRIIICMVKVIIPGKTGGNMRVNTLTIKNMDMVFIPGQMAVNIMETGKTESSMEKVNIFFPLEYSVKVFGKTVTDLNGLRI